jgi:hypothetical protein
MSMVLLTKGLRLALACVVLAVIARMVLIGFPPSEALAGPVASNAAVGPLPPTASPLQPYLRLPAPPGPRLPSGRQPQGAKDFGSSVSISGDGSVALIGAPGNGAWVYGRSGATWTLEQQLTTLGGFVALSSDGSTALVGAPCEHETSTALIFIRSGSSWTQQGPPLAPNDAQAGKACGGFGSTVALSADGSAALIGGPSDASHLGAAWIFARSSSGWTQQGPKLRPVDESGPGSFAASVALSADGMTALIGGPEDGSPPLPRERPDPHVGTGAAWVFTRSGLTWTQRQRLKPSDEVLSEEGRGLFGSAVALSGDGSTALVGGEGDNEQGAAWAFTRSGATWLQQGPKLIGLHEHTGFGGGLSLSGDGNAALVSAVPSYYARGEYAQGWTRGGAGTIWPFTRIGSTWIRGVPAQGLNPQGANEEFAYSFALSASGDTALVGAPDGFDDPGAAWGATLGPVPANSFSSGRITIRPNATLDQQLSSSGAGTFSALATISPHALPQPIARERRAIRRCHAKHRRRKPCPRSGPVTYGSAAVQVAGPSTLTLSVSPGPAVRRALERYRELKVTLTIGFHPNAGPSPPDQSRVIVVELGRRESY